MLKNLARKGVVAAALALCAFGLVAPANAGDITVWHPVTAAGGAPVDPSFWNTEALVPFSGAGLSNQNITLAPSTSVSTSTSTYNDYSTPTTNVAGGQTNVSTSAQFVNGGSYTVSTVGDQTNSGAVDQHQNTTSVNTNATLGDGSSLTASGSSN